MANNMDKLTQFGEQIRKYVSDDVAEQYMGLAARWVSGEIRMDKVSVILEKQFSTYYLV